MTRRPGITAPTARLLATLLLAPLLLTSLLLTTGRVYAALLGSCSIEVLSPGAMAANASIDTLGSKQAGGQSAQVRVQPFSLVCAVLSLLDCWGIKAVAPAGFTAFPAGGDTGVTFGATYVLGGVEYPGGVETPMPNGTHLVEVDLTAQRAAGVYPSGVYQAIVTVRCE